MDTPLVVYAITERADSLRALVNRTDCALVPVPCGDWNRDLSPWPAPACFRGGGDFAGGAGRFLAELTGEIAPRAEKTLGIANARRAICGYSLAGLFALYALYRSDFFVAAASASGSMWYDGWIEFMRSHQTRINAPRIYLSLGDREANTKNARLATVLDCTREAEAILSARGARTAFEMNPGNHFKDADVRLAKGILWLLDHIE